MKHYLLVMASAAGLLMTASCAKKTTTKSPCADVACTLSFGFVPVDVKNSAGTDQNLDSSYTLRKSNGEKIYHAKGGVTGNSYIVLDDGYQQKLVNSSDTFYFVGYLKGGIIINEPYAFSADCCHISKQSGKETIIVP